MFDSEVDFITKISSLVEHLKYLAAREKLVRSIIRKQAVNPHLKNEIESYLAVLAPNSSITDKEFTYTNSIVSLYGYLESFLEAITREFIQNLNQISIPYSSLPKEIRRSHLNLSMDLLKKIQRRKTHTSIEKNNIIKEILFNSRACIEEIENYQLNEEAYSLHSANFRYDSIHEYFCKIGINGLPRLTIREAELRFAIAEKHSIDVSYDDKVFVSLLAAELDDLAQRRNEIAHGSFNGELESIDLIIARALCIKAFGRSVGKALTDYYHEFVFDSPATISLGMPAASFTRISTLGFLANANSSNVSTFVVNLGDILFAKNEDSAEVLKYGKVVSIFNDKQAVESLSVPCSADFTIKVDFEFNSRMQSREIYILGKSLSM